MHSIYTNNLIRGVGTIGAPSVFGFALAWARRRKFLLEMHFSYTKSLVRVMAPNCAAVGFGFALALICQSKFLLEMDSSYNSLVRGRASKLGKKPRDHGLTCR